MSSRMEGFRLVALVGLLGSWARAAVVTDNQVNASAVDPAINDNFLIVSQDINEVDRDVSAGGSVLLIAINESNDTDTEESWKPNIEEEFIRKRRSTEGENEPLVRVKRTFKKKGGMMGGMGCGMICRMMSTMTGGCYNGCPPPPPPPCGGNPCGQQQPQVEYVYVPVPAPPPPPPPPPQQTCDPCARRRRPRPRRPPPPPPPPPQQCDPCQQQSYPNQGQMGSYAQSSSSAQSSSYSGGWGKKRK